MRQEHRVGRRLGPELEEGLEEDLDEGPVPRRLGLTRRRHEVGDQGVLEFPEPQTPRLIGGVGDEPRVL